jgi:hypothetical protein
MIEPSGQFIQALPRAKFNRNFFLPGSLDYFRNNRATPPGGNNNPL